MKKNQLKKFLIFFIALNLLGWGSIVLAQSNDPLGCCETVSFQDPQTNLTTYKHKPTTKSDCDKEFSANGYRRWFTNQNDPDYVKCFPKQQTQNVTNKPVKTPPIDIFANLAVEIPGLDRSAKIKCDEQPDGTYICDNLLIGLYINALYNYGLSIIGILAAAVIMSAGVIWMLAGGNEANVGRAKTMIAAALSGLALALCSYLLLNLINPEILKNKNLQLKNIDLDEAILQEATYLETAKGIGSKSIDCFYKNFGKSAQEVEKRLVTIQCFGKNIRVHEQAKEAFKEACKAIPPGTKTTCGTELLNGGTFNWRSIRGSNNQSMHSWGIAIDISPNACGIKDNQLRKNLGIKENDPCPNNLPNSVINAFKQAGFRWGGDYKRKCDVMHFEWLGNCKK